MNRKEDVFVSAVVYLSDESDNINQFTDKLIEKLAERFKHYEIIIVNDCCMHQQKFLNDYINELKDNNITIVDMSLKQGIEAVMRSGIDVAIGDFVYEFDTLEYDFEKDVIWESYLKAIEGNDIVSVEIINNSFSRKLFYKLFNKYSKSSYDIHASVFRLVSRRAINRVLALNMNCEFRQAVYSACGLKNGIIEYSGTASSKKSRSIMLAIDSFVLYTDVPKKIGMYSIKLMLFLMTIGLIFGITNIVHPLNWIGTLMSWIILVGVADIVACLVVILSYVRLIYNKSTDGENYLIEDVRKIQR